MRPGGNIGLRRAARLGLLALLAAGMVACSSRPKPLGPVAPTPPPPPAPYQTSPAPGPGAVEEGQSAPVPGSVRDFVVNVGDRVYFDFDRFNLRDDARPILDAQAAWLTRYPTVRVRIEGNCDERGTREYNFALGARRAATVKAYLASRGVAASRIDTVSFGKEHPIDMGSGDEADQHNRNAHTALTEGAS
ncbi:MAG TPA: peptidoglycan-associated lipoprotein Pal [Caulobacteraceae bacterium]|nr:peptidoglycan-associated lipoprotein Pal [Caulobacteraceae bacterium]